MSTAFPLRQAQGIALKRLIPHQPAQQRCMTDTVMTADKEEIQCAWSGIADIDLERAASYGLP
jgi:hypothetical protein